MPRSSTQPAPARLAAGHVPPTNRWFSGLVFGDRRTAVFPLPLSFTPQAHGFAIGLPRVTATADTIAGPAVADFGLDLDTTSMTVTRYDALTVTMRYGTAADVTLAEGWPYVDVRARTALTAHLSVPVAASSAPGVLVATIDGTAYAIRAPAGAVAGSVLRLQAGERAVLFAQPSGVDVARMATGARSSVTGGSASATVLAHSVATVLRYRTTDGPTVLAALPYQQVGGAGCRLGEIAAVDGALQLCRGTALTFAVPRRTPSATLPGLGDLSAADRAVVRSALAEDVAATPSEPPDSYGAGKWLYRLANLLQVARAVNDDDAAAAARSHLDAALEQWTDVGGCVSRATHCFVYDPTIRGVVGHEASFGSDQFNDHHFHYGYFLYAAAVAVGDRAALRSRIAPVIDALAADIAAPTTTATAPALRVFDAYAGHSWASGYAPFADGNDEESSSEAVEAWNGLGLWARAIHDVALAQEAVTLLSSEAATARSDWLYPDLTAFSEYKRPFIALVWGGKRDATTWFSADPSAELAIQLIPMPPSTDYLRTARSRMREELAAAQGPLFPDYLAMYSRLAGAPRAVAISTLSALPEGAFDAADSRAYALAYVMTQ